MWMCFLTTTLLRPTLRGMILSKWKTLMPSRMWLHSIDYRTPLSHLAGIITSSQEESCDTVNTRQWHTLPLQLCEANVHAMALL